MPFPNEDTINPDSYNLWVCASLNKNQDVMNRLIDSCRPINISRVAGSGNKFVHMIDQKSDYYINLVPGFKYWDMCASEALI
jgi:3'-phosphoadenosine 5'-phosphosulfate (PAPS) 3'-phosphatase